MSVRGYVHKSTGPPGAQKRASEPFVLKLRVHLSHLMWLQPNLGPLQGQHTLLTAEPPLQDRPLGLMIQSGERSLKWLAALLL